VTYRHQSWRVLWVVPLLVWAWAFFSPRAIADEQKPKAVLVVVEGTSSLKNYAMGDGRQLANLLAHFHTVTTVQGVNEYVVGQIDAYDYVFYVGFHPSNPVPARFLEDVLAAEKPVIWLNTGFHEFSTRFDLKRRLGFAVSRLDSVSQFTGVKSGGRTFTKGEPNLNIIEIANPKVVTVLATAVSSRTKAELPYIVQSGHLTYIADSPFASASSTDRYLLFADMLHDILRENHEESHSAIIRIEDVTPLENPTHLRDVADILSGRNIPFLVGVVPFYVDPGSGIRVSLSDKPEIVDALKYMVMNGGTIVMHGVTHQYRGVTASDYEFWDESTNRPIKDETVVGIARKLETGIQEFMKNGLYPLLWETPHYTASFKLYTTVASYFSTAMEQRLSIEDFDYSQYFPYIIPRDLFGQRIIPENLGYVPLDPDRARSEGYIRDIIAGARANLAVRDGFAACFFHAFVDLDLLKELVDGVEGLGYTYIDLRDQTNWVHTKDRVILSGSQSYSVVLDDQYLSETTYDHEGDIVSTVISDKRIKGRVARSVQLAPGQFYRAEPVEFRERAPSFVENLVNGAEGIVRRLVSTEEGWKEARVAVLWDYAARGGAYNDQASFVSAIRSVNIPVDTIFAGQTLNLAKYNLVIVPYGAVDSLTDVGFDRLTQFVESGGNLITDARNDLVENFGITFGDARLKVIRAHDLLFPEERMRWRLSEVAYKFDSEDVDEVYCADDVTGAPLVIGKKWGKGKVLYFATRFDPVSQQGYSFYPYLVEYVRSYFRLGPVLRRDNLEVFFEPGARRNISIESLVRQWVRQGIRIIHVSGWHQYPKYTYDYDRLLRLAHANGILVYAWLEPPQVSQKFWLEHPEWREKNFRGQDIQPSWRYPVALTDEKCLEAMLQQYDSFLRQYDWDGINLAELYFDAGRGFLDPQLFTPMHPSARREFKRRHGFDLPAIFDSSSSWYWKANPEAASAVTEYRVQVVTHVYEMMLPMIMSIQSSKPGFQVIVTAMDSYGSPELREYFGVDMASILRLQKRFGFCLQVEDPESEWSSDPYRYVGMAHRYRELTGDSAKVFLDLNILSFRKPDVTYRFPTLVQTGTECFHVIRAATLGAPRFTVYSESSMNPQDLLFMPYVASARATYQLTENGYLVSSPVSLNLRLPPDIHLISVDGVPLTPTRDNLYMIPAGEHAVDLTVNRSTTFTPSELETRLLSISGNLLSVQYGLRSASFEYEADTRVLASLNRQPTSLAVDGAAYPLTVAKGNDCFTLSLPPGRHRVELVAGDPFSYGVNVTSFWSTTAIAMFGILAVAALVGMYLVLKFLKRRLGGLEQSV
jgi:uncharacterized protein YdaL